MTLRVALYADQRSKVDFLRPEASAIVREFRRVLGDRMELTPVMAEDVRSGAAFAEKPHVFILPGIFGEHNFYPDHIGEEGYKRIRDYTQQGGVFKGFCAGAWDATKGFAYRFLKGQIVRSNGKNLRLSDTVEADGPLENYCGPIAETRDQLPVGLYQVEPVPVILCHNNTRIELAYGQGPIFRLKNEANEKITIIARYADVAGTPPAILEERIGDGVASLYGVLPQIAFEHYPAFANSKVGPGLQKLSVALREHREARTALWNAQIQRITDHHGLHI